MHHTNDLPGQHDRFSSATVAVEAPSVAARRTHFLTAGFLASCFGFMFFLSFRCALLPLPMACVLSKWWWCSDHRAMNRRTTGDTSEGPSALTRATLADRSPWHAVQAASPGGDLRADISSRAEKLLDEPGKRLRRVGVHPVPGLLDHLQGRGGEETLDRRPVPGA